MMEPIIILFLSFIIIVLVATKDNHVDAIISLQKDNQQLKEKIYELENNTKNTETDTSTDTFHSFNEFVNKSNTNESRSMISKNTQQSNLVQIQKNKLILKNQITVYQKLKSNNFFDIFSGIHHKKLQKYPTFMVSSNLNNQEIELLINELISKFNHVHSDMCFLEHLSTSIYLSNFGTPEFKCFHIDTLVPTSPSIMIHSSNGLYTVCCSVDQYNRIIDLVQPILDRDYEFYMEQQANISGTLNSSNKKYNHLTLVK